MIRTVCRVAIVLAGTVVLSGSVQGADRQRASTQPQAPVFKSGVELMAVDVSVVDGSGQPVRGLRPDQFEVLLDGRPRRVASAEMLDFVTSAKPAGPAAAVARPVFSSNEHPVDGAAVGRLIYIAVDQASFRTAGAYGAMEAARRFIDRVQPSDRVGLIAFPVPGPVIDASRNHELARTAMTKILGTADPLRSQTGSRVSLSLAEGIDIRANEQMVFDGVVVRECPNLRGPTLEGCKQDVLSEAAGIGLAADIQANRSISGLQGVIRGLAQIRERKILVLVSAGLPVSDRIGANAQNSGPIYLLGREAAAANLSLHVLHIDSTFLDAFSPANRRGPGLDSDLWREMSMMSTGLEIVAASGGGSLHRVVAGAEAAFDQVLRETAASYVLGVEPAEGDRDGKTHRIRVRVSVPGVGVHSRTEVVLPRVTAKSVSPEEAIAEVLRAPSLATGLPVRATTNTMAKESGSGLQVLVSAEIGEGLTGPVGMQVGYVVLDTTGRVSRAAALKPQLTPRATSRAGAAALLIDTALRPGSYVLRLAATDPAGRSGSVEHPFTVGLTDGDGVRIGDLLLLDPLRAKEEGVAVVTDGQLWGQSVQAYVEFTSDAGQPAARTVMFEIADRSDGVSFVSLQVSASRKDANAPWTAGARLDLRALPPGDYVAGATINDANRRLGRVERPLHIERRAPVRSVTGGAGTPAPRVRFVAGESGSLVRAFSRMDVLRGDALDFFLSRLRGADGSAASSAAVGTASIALREGKFDDALSALAGEDPAKLAGTFLKGLALFGKGDLDPAAAQFRASLRLEPEFVPAAFYLGACYAAGGRDREALDAWQLSLASESAARIVYDVIADALLRLGYAEQAVSILTEAREKWVDDDSFVPRLAASRALLDQGKEALALLEPYIARHQADVDAIFLALRLMYDIHAAGRRVKTAADDAAAAHEWAEWYWAAGGPNAPLVARWAAYIARSK